jgi:hypothetical protein
MERDTRSALMPEQTFRLRRLHVVAFAGIAGMALAGCNTTTIDDGSAEAPAGVCSHTYREPVFNISYAVNALTGESLGTIVIQSISINDRLVTDDNNPLISSQNIERVDGHWRCSLPCGLGNEEGRYRVVVDAPGYLPKGYKELWQKGRERVSPLSVILGMNNAANAHISIQLGLGGVSMSHTVACASSAIAIGEAFRRVRSGEAPVMLTGGLRRAAGLRRGPCLGGATRHGLW